MAGGEPPLLGWARIRHNSAYLGGLGRGLRPGQVLAVIGRVRAFGEYVRSGEDADNPAVRTARIRAELERLLTIPDLSIPGGALEPYLDFVAARIASRPPVRTQVRSMKRTKAERGSLSPNSTDRSTTTIAHATYRGGQPAAATTGPPSM
jgi:hypothetical protein